MDKNKDIPQIGQMDWRISILTYAKSNDSKSNEETLSYSVDSTIWANVDFSGGDEKFIEGGEFSINPITVTVRYNATLLDKKNRVRIDSTDYDIESVQIIGRKEYLKLKCLNIE